jgi:hypothetical protein
VWSRFQHCCSHELRAAPPAPSPPGRTSPSGPRRSEAEADGSRPRRRRSGSGGSTSIYALSAPSRVLDLDPLDARRGIRAGAGRVASGPAQSPEPRERCRGPESPNSPGGACNARSGIAMDQRVGLSSYGAGVWRAIAAAMRRACLPATRIDPLSATRKPAKYRPGVSGSAGAPSA